jgi:hypothetical protein
MTQRLAEHYRSMMTSIVFMAALFLGLPCFFLDFFGASDAVGPPAWRLMGPNGKVCQRSNSYIAISDLLIRTE